MYVYSCIAIQSTNAVDFTLYKIKLLLLLITRFTCFSFTRPRPTEFRGARAHPDGRCTQDATEPCEGSAPQTAPARLHSELYMKTISALIYRHVFYTADGGSA